MDKTVKLEWHKLSNTRTRCLRITQASGLTLFLTPSAFQAITVELDGVCSLLSCALLVEIVFSQYWNEPKVTPEPKGLAAPLVTFDGT